MNLYLIEKDADKNRIEIFEAVRRGLQDLYPGSTPESHLTYETDRESAFFLRCTDRRLWGKVFYESLSHGALEALTFEIESLPRPLQTFLFFPSLARGVPECLAEIPGRPFFFEYCFLRPSKAGQEEGGGLALRQWFSAHEEKAPDISKTRVSVLPKKTDSVTAREVYHFYKQARLSREEFSELLEMGLDLKKLSPA